MISFSELKPGLQKPVQREAIIEIIANGLNTSKTIKALAYVTVQRMTQDELDTIAGLALEAIGFIEADDIPGLEAFLQKCKLPTQISGFITAQAQAMLDRYHAENTSSQ